MITQAQEQGVEEAGSNLPKEVGLAPCEYAALLTLLQGQPLNPVIRPEYSIQPTHEECDKPE